MLKKTTKITILVILSLSFIISVTTLLAFQSFASRTNQSSSQLYQNILPAIKDNLYQNQTKINFIVLGLDPRNDQLEKTNTTDTIILASLNLKNYQLTLIPLPRDLWFYPIDAKINQIYPLSLQQSQNQLEFIQDNFSQLTGQTIDHTLIITTQDLIDFVDLIGNVDVFLPQGFTDEQFPNPDYIKDPTSQTPVYIAIHFDSGWNRLDQSNISHFVRSRKNAPDALSGGTDIGRSQRQQLLIEAIVGQLKNTPPRLSRLTGLYNFFHQKIQNNFSDRHLFSLLFNLQKNISNIHLEKINLPTGEDPQIDLLYYPGYLFHGQWVFIPQGENYQALQQFIADSL